MAALVLGLGLGCTPASSPHDPCFQVSSGAHAAIACESCHSTVPADAGWEGTCSTGTATCTSCHTHGCNVSDAQHTNVLGYVCAEARCVGCHKAGR